MRARSAGVVGVEFRNVLARRWEPSSSPLIGDGFENLAGFASRGFTRAVFREVVRAARDSLRKWIRQFISRRNECEHLQRGL